MPQLSFGTHTQVAFILTLILVAVPLFFPTAGKVKAVTPEAPVTTPPT